MTLSKKSNGVKRHCGGGSGGELNKHRLGFKLNPRTSSSSSNEGNENGLGLSIEVSLMKNDGDDS